MSSMLDQIAVEHLAVSQRIATDPSVNTTPSNCGWSAGFFWSEWPVAHLPSRSIGEDSATFAVSPKSVSL